MVPHVNKYGSANSRKDLIEKRRQQKREKIASQKAAQLRAAVLLAIVAISIQAMALILTFFPSAADFIILPGLLGLLVGGMAIGLVHSDKKKKTFVYVIFTVNILIGIYSGYVFIESTQPKEITKEDLQKYNTLNTSFQEKVRQQEIKDSLERVNANATAQDTALTTTESDTDTIE